MPHFVITGPGLESKTWSFPDVDVFTIGRARTCDLVLPDPKRMVSQSHAAVVRFSSTDEQYFVRDLGSRDSTSVGGENVYQRILREGDRIDIADYRLLFRREATARTTLPRLRIVTSKDCDDGAGGETIANRDFRALFRADAPGQEIVEQFSRLSDRGGSMASLFDEFMPRILNYIDADRGFVARFTSSDAREYEEVTGFGLSTEDQIAFADETCIDRLLLSEIVQDQTTLLVPMASEGGVRGFFCLDRRTPRVRPFSSEHTSLLLRIGELAAQCCEANPAVAFLAPSDDVKAWPLGLIGNSKSLTDLKNSIARAAKAAKAKRNVLVLGETGTGKQLVADALHRLAHGKSAREMEERDCAVIPENLAETALFGSEKGAFTGSIKTVVGMFEVAHGTSLFLDEIQALPNALQHKFFRVLMEKKVRRVGAQQSIPVDVFVIAAIMTTPNTEVERAFLERFGEKINVPPLRERREDIPLLVFQFIDGCAAAGSRIRSISHRALELLMKYDWPGNVRELKNFIENVAERGTEIILSSDLPPAITMGAQADQPASPQQPGNTSDEGGGTSLRTLAEIEKEAIQATLAKTGGNIAWTARILDIAEMTVRNKMKAYDIPGGYGKGQK